MATSSALVTIERLLDGKTTLKTQRASHSNIICVGTELLNHVQAIMREDKEKAVQEAVAEVEKRAAVKLRSEIELVTDILTKEKKRELRALKKDHKKEIADVLVKCKLEEDARAQEAYDRYQSEKEAAIRETLEREQKLRDEFVAKEIKRIMEILKEEARQERERELLLQKKLLKEEADKEKELAISETRKTCENEKKSALDAMRTEYNLKIDDLEKSIKYVTEMLEIEKKRKEDLHEMFLELKEDYKRFQNYTGKFHSDYLLS
ncbi:uncharacterized protein LOC135684117 [Rhopilema esculentum]|uniref:uncharacterized protein LOC135684117 n=1 Tax=Rhopilema esculentum TaxID=499914 RepID=UPI0031DC8F43|eukprot:gene16218-7592_t